MLRTWIRGVATTQVILIASLPLHAQDPHRGKQLHDIKNWVANQPVPKSVIQSTRAFRERLLDDPHRPAYHFVLPEDWGRPGDPNGAFYHNGRYHLMYLYKRAARGFSYGHISSRDLLHWRHHPDAIGPGDGDKGVFSGGGFVDKTGKAVITYWEFMGDEIQVQHDEGTYQGRPFGIGIAESSDEHFDVWTKSAANPVIASTHWGITETKGKDGRNLIYGSADPSQIWEQDGRYYMLTGNLLILRKYGQEPDSPPEYRGDHLYLFVSDDMQNWNYLHEFYERDPNATADSEDNMCPSFLPLPLHADGGQPSGKHLLLFISHNKGCQYYVGTYKDDRFYPDNHGRMTWVDFEYFAPEALIDGQGRQIMWAWLREDNDLVPNELQDDPNRYQKIWDDNYYGWSGVYGLPRSLWLGADGTLRMKPVKELTTLRYNERTRHNFGVSSDSELDLTGFGNELLELEITARLGTARQFGVVVNRSEDGQEKTRIYYDAARQELCCDATRSSLSKPRQHIESGPFALKGDEPLVLRVFVDKGIVEAYANDRQAVSRLIYPTLGGRGVSLFAKGGEVEVLSVKAWQLMPTNPY